MDQEKDSAVILVTGASGFIASWVTKKLQEQGYRVRGTVRSLQNEKKVTPLKNLCPGAKYPLELVEADLMNPESWHKAVDGCKYVMHLASPFPKENPKDPEKELIKPAVEGTTCVLKACQAAKVKRVVLTSSVAAVSGAWGDAKNPKRVFTEEDWTDITKCQQYEKSKTLAEKAGWDLWRSLPEDDRFELAVVNPVYVLGPVLSGSNCTSMEVPRRLLQHEMPAIPKIWFEMIDVRDVAEAHIRAMSVPEAAGHRHLLSSGGMWMNEIAKMLGKEFKSQGYSIPTLRATKGMLHIYGLVDKTSRVLVDAVGLKQILDTTRMKTVLGIEPRPLQDTIYHMSYNLIDQGWIKKTKKYKGCPPEYSTPDGSQPPVTSQGSGDTTKGAEDTTKGSEDTTKGTTGTGDAQGEGGASNKRLSTDL